MDRLPLPTDTQFDCCWLPRLLAKARQLMAGDLDAAYAAFFCGPGSVDAHFLDAFGLSKEAVLEAAAMDEPALRTWFTSLPDIDQKVAAWNALAPRLGEPGMPMEERLRDALANRYPHLAGMTIQSVFAMLEADEA